MSEDTIDAIVARAKAAQALYESKGSQERYDRAAQAAAWAIMEPARNRELAELAVQTTGLGNVPDKITKNHRKTLGLMHDIQHAMTCGVIADDPATGITEIARAKGVVARPLKEWPVRNACWNMCTQNSPRSTRIQT